MKLEILKINKSSFDHLTIIKMNKLFVGKGCSYSENKKSFLQNHDKDYLTEDPPCAKTENKLSEATKWVGESMWPAEEWSDICFRLF
jgi:hypothetical protein